MFKESHTLTQTQHRHFSDPSRRKKMLMDCQYNQDWSEHFVMHLMISVNSQWREQLNIGISWRIPNTNGSQSVMGRGHELFTFPNPMLQIAPDADFRECRPGCQFPDATSRDCRWCFPAGAARPRPAGPGWSWRRRVDTRSRPVGTAGGHQPRHPAGEPADSRRGTRTRPPSACRDTHGHLSLLGHVQTDRLTGERRRIVSQGDGEQTTNDGETKRRRTGRQTTEKQETEDGVEDEEIEKQRTECKERAVGQQRTDGEL